MYDQPSVPVPVGGEPVERALDGCDFRVERCLLASQGFAALGYHRVVPGAVVRGRHDPSQTRGSSKGAIGPGVKYTGPGWGLRPRRVVARSGSCPLRPLSFLEKSARGVLEPRGDPVT